MILTVTMNASIDKRYIVEQNQEGQVNRVLSSVYTAGGKGLNVSKSIALAGMPVWATGLTAGYAGAYIEENLEKHKIANKFLRVKGESRSCINIWDKKKKIQTEFLEPGFVVSPVDYKSFLERFTELVNDVAVVAISGSVPMGIPENVYHTLVSIVKKAQKKVILDSSGKLLEEGIAAKPTMIKPNIDEIRMLTGQACNDMPTLVQGALRLREKGVEIVVISLGAGGSILVSSKGVYSAEVPIVQAANTVGCGDAMVAGFALGLQQGLNDQKMLNMASAISAASAMSEETGAFQERDRCVLEKQIIITKLD